jgi:tetratricopeptide (TPR) repeat protein
MIPDEIARHMSAARDALKSGRIESARAIAEEVLREAPANIDALEIRALVALERGDDFAAEEAFRLAIALSPERQWPYADLARLLLKLNRTEEAEAVTRHALAADPHNADAHAMLGALFARREQWVQATKHYETAISFAGEHPFLIASLGKALLRRGRLDEGRKKLEAAVAADPAALEPLVNLAEAEERLGLFDQAMRHLDLAERLAQRAGTDVDLQRSVLLSRMGEEQRALDLLDSRTDLSGAALLQRGRLRERGGRYTEAWEDWTRGKAELAKRSGRRYAADEVQTQAQRLCDFFGSPEAAALPRASRRSDVPQPIFVVAFPRSGTTLIEQILTSHSAIGAGGELPFGADLHEFATVLAGGKSASPEGLAALGADAAEAFRDFYLQRAESYGLLSGGDHFTDKMPDNAFWLPLLRIAFPQSPVVFVRRHPLDILTSVMAHDMTHGFNCGYRLKDAARHLALVDRLVESYRLSGFGPTHELHYESLVEDQVGETERLMHAIGLPMEPAQLHFHERAEVSPTPSYAQVQQPLNNRSTSRWRNFAAELAPIRAIVAHAMARGNYAG